MRWSLISTVFTLQSALLIKLHSAEKHEREHLPPVSSGTVVWHSRPIGHRTKRDDWTPIGHGDPLKNDPTFQYAPPVLLRPKSKTILSRLRPLNFAWQLLGGASKNKATGVQFPISRRRDQAVNNNNNNQQQLQQSVNKQHQLQLPWQSQRLPAPVHHTQSYNRGGSSTVKNDQSQPQRFGGTNYRQPTVHQHQQQQSTHREQQQQHSSSWQQQQQQQQEQIQPWHNQQQQQQNQPWQYHHQQQQNQQWQHQQQKQQHSISNTFQQLHSQQQPQSTKHQTIPGSQHLFAGESSLRAPTFSTRHPIDLIPHFRETPSAQIDDRQENREIKYTENVYEHSTPEYTVGDEHKLFGFASERRPLQPIPLPNHISSDLEHYHASQSPSEPDSNHILSEGENNQNPTPLDTENYFQISDEIETSEDTTSEIETRLDRVDHLESIQPDNVVEEKQEDVEKIDFTEQPSEIEQESLSKQTDEPAFDRDPNLESNRPIPISKLPWLTHALRLFGSVRKHNNETDNESIPDTSTETEVLENSVTTTTQHNQNVEEINENRHVTAPAPSKSSHEQATIENNEQNVNSLSQHSEANGYYPAIPQFDSQKISEGTSEYHEWFDRSAVTTTTAPYDKETETWTTTVEITTTTTTTTATTTTTKLLPLTEVHSTLPTDISTIRDVTTNMPIETTVSPSTELTTVYDETTSVKTATQTTERESTTFSSSTTSPSPLTEQYISSTERSVENSNDRSPFLNKYIRRKPSASTFVFGQNDRTKSRVATPLRRKTINPDRPISSRYPHQQLGRTDSLRDRSSAYSKRKRVSLSSLLKPNPQSENVNTEKNDAKEERYVYETTQPSTTPTYRSGTSKVYQNFRRRYSPTAQPSTSQTPAATTTQSLTERYPLLQRKSSLRRRVEQSRTKTTEEPMQPISVTQQTLKTTQAAATTTSILRPMSETVDIVSQLTEPLHDLALSATDFSYSLVPAPIDTVVQQNAYAPFPIAKVYRPKQDRQVITVQSSPKQSYAQIKMFGINQPTSNVLKKKGESATTRTPVTSEDSRSQLGYHIKNFENDEDKNNDQEMYYSQQLELMKPSPNSASKSIASAVENLLSSHPYMDEGEKNKAHLYHDSDQATIREDTHDEIDSEDDHATKVDFTPIKPEFEYVTEAGLYEYDDYNTVYDNRNFEGSKFAHDTETGEYYSDQGKIENRADTIYDSSLDSSSGVSNKYAEELQDSNSAVTWLEGDEYKTSSVSSAPTSQANTVYSKQKEDRVSSWMTGLLSTLFGSNKKSNRQSTLDTKPKDSLTYKNEEIDGSINESSINKNPDLASTTPETPFVPGFPFLNAPALAGVFDIPVKDQPYQEALPELEREPVRPVFFTKRNRIADVTEYEPLVKMSQPFEYMSTLKKLQHRLPAVGTP